MAKSNQIWIDEAACGHLFEELMNTRWSNLSEHSKAGIIYMISTPAGNHWITRDNNRYKGFVYLFQNTMGMHGRYYIPALDKSFDNSIELKKYLDNFYQTAKLAKVLYE